MRSIVSAGVIAIVCAAAMLSAQAPRGEPFGIGTFRYQGRTFVGLVLRAPTEPLQPGGFVVDLAAAAKAANQAPVPTDLLAIIEQYDSGVGNRLRAIARDVAGRLDANRPAYVYDYKAVDALMPFKPSTALYGRANYPSHLFENEQEKWKNLRSTPERPPALPGLWERAAADERQNPYLFLVAPAAFTGDGDAIEIAPKRTDIDYECEQVVVIGKPARHVSISAAKDYIFGYAQTNDVSDRQARMPEDPNIGGDWWVQKSQHSFKPWGPYIVPKEFHDPLNARTRFSLNGRILQDQNISTAIQNVYDYVSYASNVHTLGVGDIIGMGTVGGVGMARTPPVWMKPGDVASCSHDRLGTLTNPVVGERMPTSSASR